MATGYGILGTTIVVLFTAMFRGRIGYNLFFFSHLLVLVMYLLALLHTIDNEVRAGKVRSQSFRWFTASLLIYISDRAWRHCTVHHSSAASGWLSADGTTIALKIQRPPTFVFVPGQYASLQIKQFELIFHPFSIGSDPVVSLPMCLSGNLQ